MAKNKWLCFEPLEARRLLAAMLGSKTDYWLAFESNYDNLGVTLTLLITSATTTTGFIDIPGLQFNKPFRVTPSHATSVDIPTAALVTSDDGVAQLGVHVTALEPVSIYGLDVRDSSADGFLGLPVEDLGNEYIVMSYTNSTLPATASIEDAGSQFAVVGTQNNTIVMITPSISTGGHPAGLPYSVTIDEGQIYELADTDLDSDLTGTIIRSDKPVAVFSGDRITDVPKGVVAADTLVEQLPPTSGWGTKFVTLPLATRQRGDTFRILASTDDTIVTINGVVAGTLDRGKFLERTLTEGSVITSDKPTLVAQFANGTNFDNVLGDPFMSLVPPVNDFQSIYTIAIPALGFSVNYLNVIAPENSVGSVTIDGINRSNDFSRIGSSSYFGASISIAPGAQTHIVLSGTPVGVTVYGFGDATSYGYPGGMALTADTHVHVPVTSPIVPVVSQIQPPAPTMRVRALLSIVQADSIESRSNSATIAARDAGGSQVVALAQRDSIFLNWQERDIGGGAEEIPMRTPNVVMVQFQTIIPDVQTAELSDTKPDLPDLPELRPASDESLIPPRAPIALLTPKVEPRSWYMALASGIALAGSLLVIVVPVLIRRRRARRILRFGAAQFSEIEGTQELNSDNIIGK